MSDEYEVRKGERKPGDSISILFSEKYQETDRLNIHIISACSVKINLLDLTYVIILNVLHKKKNFV